MAAGWLKQEWTARIFMALLLIGLPVGILAARWGETAVTIHAVMPEKGGFLPDAITAEAGKPFTLRLTSDDVLHGFAVGQSDFPAVEIKPGQMTEVTLTFDKPGTYTYYCTVWCGPNHWRMRGTIEVTGEGEMPLTAPQPPLYVTLGLDIDAPHPAEVVPAQMPAAALGTAVPPQFLSRDLYLTQSPAAVWQTLRAAPELAGFDDAALWNMVAFIWQSQATDEQRQIGAALYAQNCAACHGRTGQGDGVFGQAFDQATDFTDAQTMLGASTAVLDGKIRRGGMGTGMPYWGAIFTDEEIDALIAYLWTFQFLVNGNQ
ncbi:MAG: c-type cytochrome [Anaerolineae bacterium]